MKIKQLQWRDNLTEIGKHGGKFQEIAGSDWLDTWISITNYSHRFEMELTEYCLSFRHAKPNTSDDYGDESDERETVLRFNNIEDAKSKAQELWEDEIMELFFDIEEYELEQ